MSDYRDIIKAPIVTEKSASLNENNTVVLSVDPKANKTQIKQAVEKVFNVKVESVNTINKPTKKKRVGRYAGRTNKVNKPIPPIAAQIIKSLRSFFGEMKSNPGKNDAVTIANKLPYSMNTSLNPKPFNQYISFVTS